MERHIRDALEEEVIFDHAQFGLLNSQTEENAASPVSKAPRKLMAQKWGKLSRTAALCGAYISLGICFSVTGPTLLYLKDQVGATLSEISYIFTLRSVGTLGGAFLGGFLLDRCNPYSLFFVIIAMMAIGVGAMPWYKHLWMLMGSSILVGLANGFLDTGASTLCLQLWGKDSGPYMQALHFSYAVGGFIAPLLVQAFIVEPVAPNNTTLTRHVRSVTTPVNSSDADDERTTIASVMQSVSQIPVLEGITDANSTTPVSNSTVAGVIPTFQNQSASTTEKPKVLKPSVINGGALGDPRVFEKIPLPVPPVPIETTVSTTTVATNQNETNVGKNDTIVSANNITTEAQTVNSSNQTTPAASEVELNATTNDDVTSYSGNNSVTISKLQTAKNDTASTSDLPKTNTTISLDKFTPPLTTVPTTEVSNATMSNVSRYNEDISPSNSTEDVTIRASLSTELPITLTSATPTPTTTVTSSTAFTPTTASSTAKPTATTSAFVPVTKSLPPLTIPTSTTLPNDLTDIASKSRGKYRGQQDEIILVAPETSSIPIATTSPNDPSDIMVPKSRGKYRGQQDETTPVTPETFSLTPVVKNHPINGLNNVVTDPPIPVTDSKDNTSTKVSYIEFFDANGMHMLYTVIAIIVLHSAFAFLFFLCSNTRNSSVITTERHAADRKIKSFRPVQKLLFIALMCSFYLMYVGSEVIFAQFLTTFAIESPLKLATSTANYVTSAFWASFAVGRFVAIFVAHFTNPTMMLIFNLCCTGLGSLSLCVAGQTDVSILYVGSVLIGVGMASTFATGFVWTETHLLVTNRISAAFSISSSMGEMIFPTVIGSFMEAKPVSLMYLVFSLTLLCTLVFFAAWYLAKPKDRSFGNSPSSGYILARQADEEVSQN